jgi:hypothetical protein
VFFLKGDFGLVDASMDDGDHENHHKNFRPKREEKESRRKSMHCRMNYHAKDVPFLPLREPIRLKEKISNEMGEEKGIHIN